MIRIQTIKAIQLHRGPCTPDDSQEKPGSESKSLLGETITSNNIDVTKIYRQDEYRLMNRVTK